MLLLYSFIGFGRKLFENSILLNITRFTNFCGQLYFHAVGSLLTRASFSSQQVDEEGLLDYVQNQCLGMSLSPCSVLHKTLQLGSEPPLPPPVGVCPPPASLALLQALDGCEVASGALEAVAARPLEDNLKSSCLHHWPYLHCKQ